MALHPDDLPDVAIDARHLKTADVERDSNLSILLEGHFAALDPATPLEEIVYSIVDQVSLQDETASAPLALWGRDFNSIQSLRIYLGGLHCTVERDRLILSHDDRVGDRLPGALVSSA